MERGVQMDINQSSLSKFKSNKSDTPRSSMDTKSLSEATKLKVNSSSSSSSSIKQLDLKQGQIIKGEIIDHRYNEIRIQLEPGKQVITAQLSTDVPLSIGQEAQFEVTEDTAERLVLKFLPNETTAPSDITIQKALTASSLPMTDRNKAIVEELLNYRMPIDKQTLQALVKLSYTNREASPLTIVLMYKNKIPMTSANIKQFEAYQNGTHQLLNDINKVSKNLVELLKQSTQLQNQQSIPPNELSSVPESFHEVIQLNDKLLDILFHNSEQRSQVDTSSLPLSNFLGQEELTLLSNAVKQKIPDSLALPNGIPADITEQVMKGTLSLEDAVKMITKLYNGNSELLTPTALMETLSQQQTDRSVSTIVHTLLEKLSHSQNDPAQLASFLNSEERTVLLDSMKTFPSFGNTYHHITEGSVTVQDILTYVNENLTSAEETVAKNLLQSPEYLKLLEGAFHQKWTITPDKLAINTSVSELYQNLQEDMEKLSALEQSSKTTSGDLRLQEPVKNMQENLSFMKDLNEMFTYLQLPVQFKGHDVHSDLYVFKRKNAPHEKEENLSVLLHLDMTNLGSLNIHLQMDPTMIKAKFYLEDRSVEKLISNNLSTLTDALQKKGYHLHAEILDNYKKPDFSKDFIEQSATDSYVQRYTFDIRT
jgi:hypothetical protein